MPASESALTVIPFRDIFITYPSGLLITSVLFKRLSSSLSLSEIGFSVSITDISSSAPLFSAANLLIIFRAASGIRLKSVFFVKHNFLLPFTEYLNVCIKSFPPFFHMQQTCGINNPCKQNNLHGLSAAVLFCGFQQFVCRVKIPLKSRLILLHNGAQGKIFAYFIHHFLSG